MNNQKSWIVIFSIFLFMFIFNYLSPISFGDDYVYSFIWTGQSIYEPLPQNVSRVASWQDLFNSQWSHYFTWGGRTVAHVLAQFFLWKGKALFNFANTLISVFLVFELYWCINKGKVTFQFDYRTIIWAFFLLWACSPGFGVIFFWITGACNYLWTNVILLGFLIPYFCKYYNSERIISANSFYVAFAFIIGVLSGWTNENSVCWILLALAVFIYYCKQHNNLEIWMVSGFIGLMTGYALLMFAPGNYNRLSSSQSNWKFLTGLNEHLSMMMLIYIFQFFLWYFVIRSLFSLRNVSNSNLLLKKDVLLVKVLVIVGFCMTGIMLFSPGFPPRTGFSGLLYLIVAAGILLRIQKEYNVLLIQESAKKFLFCVSLVFFIFTAGFTFRNYYCAYVQVERMLAEVKGISADKRDSVITVKAILEPSDNEGLYTALHTLSYKLSEDEKEWKNVAFARYYGIKGIRMLKEKDYNDRETEQK
ncbi:hypothetical protein SAMN04487864_101396 [Succiniclasticum ruminis]|uniref:Uncharacterized protein n=1 Tax=Succiniclasticum ruminis TaxID=40841 RepID=A0A1G6I436_9FIRM|nr:DUF6056 family protein [Succiniclasticum ruminis]SDC00486.1 hypothetical protein SAMN04487864_101396 [Succiniclasticum ruminis]